MAEHRVQWLTRPEVAARLAACPIALVPIGSTEQHGPHLPLGTDILLAEALAERIAEKTGALVFPSINFGLSFSWRDIPGTVSISNELFANILRETVKSLERSGVKCVVFINGHDSNNGPMKICVREIADTTDMTVLGMFYPGLSRVYDRYMESPKWLGMFHADEFETSLMLAAHGGSVDMEKAAAEYPPIHPTYGMDNTPLGDITVSGVLGDPTKATKEKGEAMFEAFAENAAATIRYKLETAER